MGLTVNRQMAEILTVNRQKQNIFTVNRQMSEPKLAVNFLRYPWTIKTDWLNGVTNWWSRWLIRPAVTEVM